MNQRTSYRGPDHAGFVKKETAKNRLLFGLNRLKIQDLSEAGNQPFCSSDGRYVLCFNGEIYNFQTLQKELEQFGHVFSSHSDTEVLLYFLIQYQGKQLHRLKGMYAFVFYDLQEDQLLMARDPFGMKPLYYFNDNHRLIISSDIQAILHTGVPKVLNNKQIGHYLTFKYAKAPETFYQDIFEVEKGATTSYIDGAFQTTTIETTPETTFDHSDIVGHTKHLLQQSVKRHLISDVPSGLLLSGGIDSSLLLGIACEFGQQLPCISIGNTDAKNSFGTQDIAFSKQVAAHFGCSHNIIEASSDLLNDFDGYLDRIDQPVADGASLLTWLLTKEADQKVLLSGAGADELFGGYSRHHAFYKYLKWIKGNPLAYGSLKLVQGKFPEGRSGRFRKKFRHLNMLSRMVQKRPEDTFRNFISLRIPQKVFLSPTDYPIDFQRDDSQDPIRSMLLHEQQHYLSQDILKITDQFSMQNSTEVRLPYLDSDLVSFANSIDGKTRMSKGQKWILKEIIRDYMPEALYQRPKEGLGMPFGQWVRENRVPHLMNVLSSPKSLIFEYLHFENTQQLINTHNLGKMDYSNEIWALVVLANWLERAFAS